MEADLNHVAATKFITNNKNVAKLVCAPRIIKQIKRDCTCGASGAWRFCAINTVSNSFFSRRRGGSGGGAT